VPLEPLVGAQERVERLAAFIVEQWEERRAAMEGKAMVVTMSRDIAARLYGEIRKLRSAWHDNDDECGAMKIVMIGGASDDMQRNNPKADRAAPGPILDGVLQEGRRLPARSALTTILSSIWHRI
jgi:type I restriction enzyme, R subunit